MYAKRGKFSRYNKKRSFKKPVRKAPRMVQRSVLKSIVETTVRRNLEVKYHRTDNSTTIPTGAPTIVALSDVVQGTTDITRIGDSITLQSLEGRYYFSARSNAGNTINYVSPSYTRCMIVQWFPSTSTVVGTDILQTSYVLDFPTHDTRQQFRVLYDKMFHVTAGTSDQARMGSFRVSFNKSRSKKIQYVGGGTTGSNKIFALFWSNNDGVASVPSYSMCCKLTFSDG